MRLLRLALPLATILLAAPVARADDSADRQNQTVAGLLAKDALEYARKGEFEIARLLYTRAFDVSPSTGLLFNLALAELSSGKELDAIRHFRQYLSEQDADPKKIDVINNDLIPKAYAATGHILMNGIPADAEVSVDGVVVAVPGATHDRVLDVEPGTHDVIATTPAAKFTARATVQKGERIVAAFERSELRPALEGAGPAPRRPAPKGPAVVSSAREPYWTPGRSVGLVLLGTAVATVGVGTGFLVDSRNAAAKVADLQLQTRGACGVGVTATTPDCVTLDGERSRQKRGESVWVGSMVGAGALSAASILVYWILDRARPSQAAQSAAITMHPIFDLSTRQAGVTGSF